MNNKIFYEMNEVCYSNKTPKSLDFLFITLNNVEDRTKSALTELNKRDVKIVNLVIIDYSKQTEFINTYLNSINRCLIENVILLKADKQNYETNFIAIKQRVAIKDDYMNIGIDISCLPIPQIFLLLKWLYRMERHKIIIYYTEPERYIMNNGLFESYFSTSGPVTVREISGFSGITVKKDQNERVLLCILGFDNDLLPTVIQEAGPQSIVAINGFPSFYPKFKDISLINNEKILSGSEFASKLEKSSNLTNFVYVEADNPFDAFNVLEELKNKYDNNCIDVVPLGSKPMALGVCLFAIENKDIRVIFPFPDEYAEATGQKSSKTLEYIVK